MILTMADKGNRCSLCGKAVIPGQFICPACDPRRHARRSISFHEAIDENRKASLILTALLIATAVSLGFIIGKTQGHQLAGPLLGLSILAILAIVTLTSGRDIPLRLNNARRADAETVTLLSNIIEELKIASGLQHIPEVYVMEDRSINAFATALTEKDAAIAVTRGAIDNLTREELQGVLAHEVSHILARDSRYFLFLSVFVGSVIMISDLFLKIGLLPRRPRISFGLVLPALLLALFSPLFVTILRFAISRKREFLADARAVQITRNPTALASALRKSTGLGSSVRGVNRATRHMFILNPRAVPGGKGGFIFSTHPPLEERLRRLGMMGALFS